MIYVLYAITGMCFLSFLGALVNPNKILEGAVKDPGKRTRTTAIKLFLIPNLALVGLILWGKPGGTIVINSKHSSEPAEKISENCPQVLLATRGASFEHPDDAKKKYLGKVFTWDLMTEEWVKLFNSSVMPDYGLFSCAGTYNAPMTTKIQIIFRGVDESFLKQIKPQNIYRITAKITHFDAPTAIKAEVSSADSVALVKDILGEYQRAVAGQANSKQTDPLEEYKKSVCRIKAELQRCNNAECKKRWQAAAMAGMITYQKKNKSLPPEDIGDHCP